MKWPLVVVQKCSLAMSKLRWVVRRGIALTVRLLVLLGKWIMALIRVVCVGLTKLIGLVCSAGMFFASIPLRARAKIGSMNAERAAVSWKLNQADRDLDVDPALRQTECSVKRASFGVKTIQGWMLWGVFFSVVAFWVTRGVWLLPDRLIGGGDMPDWSGTAWAFWWTAEALGSGENPFVATHNFFPVGQSPVSQYNLVDAILAAPLVWVFGTRQAIF